MKYFTKQWHHTNRCTSLHILLKASDRAAEFSEEYFRELYDQHVREHLETMERVQAIDREALAASLESENADPVRVDGSPVTPEETDAANAFRAAIVKSLREAPPFIFDPEKVRQTAHKQYLHNLRHLENCLPEEIRAKVADLRVLALNWATREIIDEITAFANACKETVQNAYEVYRQDYRRYFPDGEPAFYRNFHLHDERLISVRQEGNDLLFIFEDNFYWRFLDAEFILREDKIEQCYWLMDEIHPAEGGGYELHALLEEITESDEIFPREFILRCRDAQTGTCPE